MKIALSDSSSKSRPYTGPVSSGKMRPGPAEVLGISIVLPARNEGSNIAAAVEKSMVIARRLSTRYEVIVVDDGSTDGTGHAVESLARQHYPQVRLVTHPENQGYGAALRTGFRESRYELVFFTDSDNQFDVSELEYFMPMMSDYDMVTGFRVYRYDTVLRCILSWFYNRLVGVLFGLRVRDVDCAFKLMRREVVQNVTIECDNFFVNTELLAKARRWNFRIAEKGVRHYPRTAGETSVRPSDIPRTLSTVFSMWRRIYFPRRAEMDRLRTKELSKPQVIEFIPARD
jgi:glycosyltransferase involved in cell wall biosynthesis